MSRAKHGLKKNLRVRLEVESIAAGGQGFSKLDGVPVFVDRGVPGDLVEVELYDVRKDFAHARITQLIEASSLRVPAPCKLFNVCGGCQWQHIDYAAQLELKTDIVRQVVRHIAGLDPAIVQPALPSPQTMRYRNKVQYPVASPKNSSRILAGYYKEGSHDLINIKHCPVQPEELDEVMEAAKLAAEHSGISAYDEASHSGLLRHLIARYSFARKEILMTLVLNADQDTLAELTPSLRHFASELMAERKQVVGCCANFNNNRGNRILGRTTVPVAGQDYIIERLESRHPQAPQSLRQGLQFRLSPASFFQVNSEQAVQLMDLVLDALLSYKDSRAMEHVPLVLDAFAGVASIALWVSPLAGRVIAVEEVTDAVANANEIMQLNSISNVETVCGRVEQVFPQLLEEGLRPDLVILDPPRKGVDRNSLNCVAQLNPQRIVYVSCNPATLARDLRILHEAGYLAQSIQPLDLFPQTFHVESVSVLDRRAESS